MNVLVTGKDDRGKRRILQELPGMGGGRIYPGRRGDGEKAGEMFKEGKENEKKVLVKTRNVNGELPIHFAAKHGSLAMIEFSYKARSDAGWLDHDERKALYNGSQHRADADVHVTTKDGWTPLFAASDSGHLKVVKFLYEHGADADIHFATNNGWTPLSAASDSGYLEVVKFLYKYRVDTDIHVTTKDSYTPLYALSLDGHLKVVKFLYEHGADTDIHFATNDGWTPLSTASSNGDLEILNFL
jgi:ankyrin repeat protein